MQIVRGSRWGGVLAMAAVFTAAGCGVRGADSDVGTVGPSHGRLVIVGGGLADENEEVFRAALDARLDGEPICVVPTAGGSPESSMEWAVEVLEHWGGPGSARGVLLSKANAEEADSVAMAEDLSHCGGYWFTGGDQSRVVDTFLPGGDTTLAYRAVSERFRAGAVMAGSSAGAAMMSAVMIASGSSGPAVVNGILSDGEGDGVWVRPGMGFFSDAVIDQHFLARGRIGRLLVVTAGRPVGVGIGIDENTALVVDGDLARVVGESGAVLVDGRHATALSPSGLAGVRVSLLGSGDSLRLAPMEPVMEATKASLDASLDVGAPPDDVFARWAFLKVISRFSADSASEVSVPFEGGAMRITKAEGFRAGSTGDGGPEGTPRALTAGPFVVDLIVSPR